MTKRFTSIIITVNIIMILLMYLSSQLVLFNLNGATLSGFDAFSIYVSPSQVPGQVIVPIEWSMPNCPFYVFLLFLIVNACFAVVHVLQLRRNKTA
jgi:hypothetical protein